jgi:hypothetical protein
MRVETLYVPPRPAGGATLSAADARLLLWRFQRQGIRIELSPDRTRVRVRNAASMSERDRRLLLHTFRELRDVLREEARPS